MILTGSTGKFREARRDAQGPSRNRTLGLKQDKAAPISLSKITKISCRYNCMRVGSEPANRRALGLQTVRRYSKTGATLAFGAERCRVREWQSPSLKAKLQTELNTMAQAKQTNVKDNRARVLLVDDHAVVRFGIAQQDPRAVVLHVSLFG